MRRILTLIRRQLHVARNKKEQLLVALFDFGLTPARGQIGVSVLLGDGTADAHAVERTVDEDERDDEEGCGQDMRQAVAALAGGELHGKLYG
jgi:hypothetical protein